MDALWFLLPFGIAVANGWRVNKDIKKNEAELKAMGLKPNYVGGGAFKSYYVTIIQEK